VATLTAGLAVCALVLLITLLFFGSVSDYLGRRRVILGALTVSACACGLFLAAHGIVLLFAARALQGIAVGAASGALGVALIELQPGRGRLAPVVTSAVPTLGLGAAALGASALVQYGPAPFQKAARWAAERTASWRCCVSAPAMNRPGSLRLDTGVGRERPPARGTS
jgi:MFS family permease